MMPYDDTPLTAGDLADITGFDERYISQHMDKANIDITSVRIIDDGRIIAKTNGGDDRILYGVDSGERGRRLYWGSFRGVGYLVRYQSDYPEIENYGARLFYPRY